MIPNGVYQGGEIVDMILESFPVGVGFHPTDQQLVDYYLIPKLRDDHSRLKMNIPGTDTQVDIIPEVDVYVCEPWELQAKLKHPVFSKFPKDEDESESFFFTRLQKKYAKGRSFKRATNDGFWKPTGLDRKIKRQGTGEVIATKKTLVFHRRSGRSASRTPWFIIYEYHAEKRFVPDDKTNYVVCRFKTEAGTRILIDQSGGPAETMTFDASNIAPDITNCKTDPQENARLDRSPVAIDSVGHSCERAAPNGSLKWEFAFDSDGYPYERLIRKR